VLELEAPLEVELGMWLLESPMSVLAYVLEIVPSLPLEFVISVVVELAPSMLELTLTDELEL
jgi:hypothetical protein